MSTIDLIRELIRREGPLVQAPAKCEYIEPHQEIHIGLDADSIVYLTLDEDALDCLKKAEKLFIL